MSKGTLPKPVTLARTTFVIPSGKFCRHRNTNIDDERADRKEYKCEFLTIKENNCLDDHYACGLLDILVNGTERDINKCDACSRNFPDGTVIEQTYTIE